MDVMDRKRNRAASSSRAAAHFPNDSSVTAQTPTGPGSDESARRALETESRLLGAFPWARYLAPTDRARFADELSNHPTEMTNNELEALLVSWRGVADAARRRSTRGDNSSRRGRRAA